MSSEPTALAKRNASNALMPPPPAPKRIKRPAVVLDEETYTSVVSHIIRRDFFPGLAETDAQREYLNAVESKDRSWIREAGKKLTQVMTPVSSGQRRLPERTRFEGVRGSADKTPSVWGADTPASVAETDDAQEEGLSMLDKADLNMSLGAFQAKYTSEDQESFSQIIDKHNRAKFDKNAWLHNGNMYASKKRIAQQKIIGARIEARKSTEIVVARPSPDMDDRPAAPAMHKHTAFNNLMFEPEGIEDWAPTRASNAERASLVPPKKVLYDNTRLPILDAETTRPPSPTLSAVRDAVAGRPRLNESEVGYTGSSTPRVNGYAFVDARALSPSSDEDDAPTDLLSRYGIDNTVPSPFTLYESSAREKMHHRMVDQISAKRSSSSSISHAQRNNPGSGLGIFTGETPRFKSAPTLARFGAAGQTPGRKGKGELTPAAQRLFDKMGGATPKSEGFGASGSTGAWTRANKGRRKL